MSKTYYIHVVVNHSQAVQGVNQVEKSLKKVEDRAESLRRTLQRALLFVGLDFTIRGLIDMADTFTNINNRIRTVTKSLELTKAANQAVLQVANETRSSYQVTAELFTRISSSVGNTDKTFGDVLRIVQTINKAVILSGATSQESRAGLMQLSQSIASNRLGGEELRSVVEQIPVVADLIAAELSKKMGKNIVRGQLRALVNNPKTKDIIDTETILDAMSRASEEIEARFSKLTPTISQAFVVLKNNATQLWGEFTTGTGLASSLANAIIWVSQNLDMFGRVAFLVGSILAYHYAVKGIGAAIKGTQQFFMVFAGGSKLKAILALVTLMAVAFATFSDRIQLSRNSSVTLFDTVSEGASMALEDLGRFWRSFKNGSDDAVSSSTSDWFDFFQDLARFFDDIQKLVAKVFLTIVKIISSSMTTVTDWVAQLLGSLSTLNNKLPEGLKDENLDDSQRFFASFRGKAENSPLLKGFEELSSRSQGPLESKFIEAFYRAEKKRADDARARRDLEKTLVGSPIDTSSPEEEAKKQLKDFESILAKKRQEIELLRTEVSLRGTLKEIQAASDTLGRNLKPSETKELTFLVQLIEFLEEADDVQKRVNDLKQEKDVFQELLDQKREEIELLQIAQPLREAAAELRNLEKSGRDLTTQEKTELGGLRAMKDFLTKQEALDSEVQEALGDNPALIQTYVERLNEEVNIIGLSNRDRRIRKALLDVEAQTLGLMTEEQREYVNGVIRATESLADQKEMYLSIVGPTDQYRRSIEALNELYARGEISMNQYQNSILQIRYQQASLATDLAGGLERGLIRLQMNFNDLGSLVDNTIVKAFQSAEDALVQFATTGKADFKALIDSIYQDLMRLAIRQAIMAPLANLIGLSPDAMAGGGGTTGGKAVTGLFNKMGGLFKGFGGLFGFANGGSFLVGGAGGVDSQAVAFRATPGERVTVTKPGQSAGGITVVNHFHLPNVVDAQGFKRSEGQLGAKMKASLERASKRNN